MRLFFNYHHFYVGVSRSWLRVKRSENYFAFYSYEKSGDLQLKNNIAGFLHLQLPFILEYLNLIENGAYCNKLNINFF